MKCKKEYSDMNKYAEYKRNYQKRYREKTGGGKYEKRFWTTEENEIILNSELSDRELSERICRSVGAIQRHRHYLKVGE